MHKVALSQRMTYYAKILLVFSITLLFYGIILDINSSQHLIDPVHDVITPSEVENTVTISTIEDTEIEVPPVEEVPVEEEKPVVTSETTPTPTQNSDPPTETPPAVSSLEEQNNQLREEILRTYGVSVRYGKETEGYTVSSGDTKVSTVPITNETTIHSQLTRLKNTLDLYPNGMFYEIKSGGIPLTVILIDRYSNPSITGITDSSYSYANISIAAMYPFEESFYHESYHYIERYLFKKGANYNSWDSLNPSSFTYGTISNELSYNMTFSQEAPFVNNYAQTADTEDRASTFEYMMAPSKASCLNKNMTVWSKAKYMALTMETTLRCANSNTVEYWERYL